MTYEYICKACGHQWEAQQSISEDPLKDCPECGKSEAKRQISRGVGFILKGGGWYSDLYASSSKTTQASESDSTSATDSKGTAESKGAADSKSTAEPKGAVGAKPSKPTPSATPAAGAKSAASSPTSSSD